MEKDTNTRFAVTTRPDGPTKLYDWYLRREDFHARFLMDMLAADGETTEEPEETATMEVTVYIGDNVKQDLISRAFKQVELAKKAGINPAALVRIGRNQSEPHMATVRKLAEALDIDLSEFAKR